jgi:hypothetical protein
MITRDEARSIWNRITWPNGQQVDGARLMIDALTAAGAFTAEPALTFEQAWAEKERKGYQYGEDALEHVRMGWDMAHRNLAVQNEPTITKAQARELVERVSSDYDAHALFEAAWAAVTGAKPGPG